MKKLLGATLLASLCAVGLGSASALSDNSGGTTVAGLQDRTRRAVPRTNTSPDLLEIPEPENSPEFLKLEKSPGWKRLPRQQRSTINFTGGFEGSNFNGWLREICCSHSAAITTSPVREGRFSARMILRRSDGDVQGSKRSELAHYPVAANSEYTYRFSLFLPSDYSYDRSFEILMQMQSFPDSNLGEAWRSPPMMLRTAYGKWFLESRWDSKQVTVNNRPEGNQTWDLGSYAKGRWTDWVIHVKWSHRSDGLLEVWRDGQLVARRVGPNTYNDARGPYFKAGIYKPDWKYNPSFSSTSQRTIYVDAVRIYPGKP
uniref:Polysaccharide lyase n=1 Tax=Cyanothece sp. (strain PCC 7425 / ATCC 29141) TaxID=395961 RepID=B8HQ90_CYAP4